MLISRWLKTPFNLGGIMYEIEKRLVVNLSQEDWEKLREIAYVQKTHMNVIVREGMYLMFNKYEKKLKNKEKKN